MTHAEELADDWYPVNPEISLPELAGRLTNAGIPLAEWGQGSAKTIGHLITEIRDGESRLSFTSCNDAVRRQLNIVSLDVLRLEEDGSILQLTESRQVYEDGRVRVRNLGTSLGEKMKPAEEPLAAALRALNEELNISEPETLHFLDIEESRYPTESYPGLESQYINHKYVATLGKQAFNPQGYIEEQPGDKTNYYKWKLVRPPVA